jgi:hypothetical protein
MRPAVAPDVVSAWLSGGDFSRLLPVCCPSGPVRFRTTLLTMERLRQSLEGRVGNRFRLRDLQEIRPATTERQASDYPPPLRRRVVVSSSRYQSSGAVNRPASRYPGVNAAQSCSSSGGRSPKPNEKVP